jgi:uncharacterized protein YjbJ (UPF0337 family)
VSLGTGLLIFLPQLPTLASKAPPRTIERGRCGSASLAAVSLAALRAARRLGGRRKNFARDHRILALQAVWQSRHGRGGGTMASLVLSISLRRFRALWRLLMNEDILKGQWTQLKGRVREQWGKLTDDDLDRIQGKSEQLIGRLQERYGWQRDQAQREVDTWLRSATTSSGAI